MQVWYKVSNQDTFCFESFALIGKQLPENDKEKLDVSSEDLYFVRQTGSCIFKRRFFVCYVTRALN